MCTHYDCSFRNSDGYCMVTACVNPNYNTSGTYIVDKSGNIEKYDNRREGHCDSDSRDIRYIGDPYV